MGPPDTTAAGVNRKVQSIKAFATELAIKLGEEDHTEAAAELLVVDIRQQIRSCGAILPGQATSVSSRTIKDLERCGRDLWNRCIRLKRDRPHSLVQPNARHLLVRAKLLAFHMIELARQNRQAIELNQDEAIYIINLALTLAKACLEQSDTESAKVALEKAAEYKQKLGPLDDSSDHDCTLLEQLEADYLTLRMLWSCQECRLDVAEHMFNKTKDLRQPLSVLSTENMADTLWHIGTELLAKADYTAAIKWLKRSYEILNAQPLEKLSIDGLDSRLAVCQSIIQALLSDGSPGSIQEANDLIAYVEDEIGDKPIVLHWQLEALRKSPDGVSDVESYSSVLKRMIRTFDFSADILNFVLHHLKTLGNRRPDLSSNLLEELLLQRLVPCGNADWIDRTVVRRVLVATMEDGPSDNTPGLVSLLDRLAASRTEQLSLDAIGAIHSLIWRRLEATYIEKQYRSAEAWCSVALHPSFSSGSELNQAKFYRKLILCAIATDDAEKAKAAFHAMPGTSQDDSLTRQSVEVIGRSEDKEQAQNILYACIKEAQSVGDKLCTLAALKAVVDSWNPETASEHNIPSILRCVIRLLHTIRETDDRDKTKRDRSYMKDTCRAFESGANFAKRNPKDTSGNTIFTIQELTWFQKNAYNIAVSSSAEWDLTFVVRLFSSCLVFIDCCPRDMPRADQAEMDLMAMRCHFVIAAALVSIARSEDRVDEHLQRYIEMRQHVAFFDERLHSEPNQWDDEVSNDLMEKLATLFAFDFEGAVCLKSWDDLDQIVRKARVCRDQIILKAMGDCLLRSQAPGRVLFRTLKLIVNEIFTLEKYDSDKLAKYIRCMLQAVLPLDDALGLQLVQQALELAREGEKVERQFPAAELEWLVATVFNHAIDFYARGDEDQCQRWALKAMDLAAYADDEGSLANSLQEKFSRLRFENGNRNKT